MKTYQKKKEEVERNWYLVDAKDAPLGRLASKVSKYLIGKHKVDYSPHVDMGDYVVVVNAGFLVLTGRKKEQKTYKSHSGYPGGFKEVPVGKVLKERPKLVVERAVFGMLPDNRLKAKRMKRLKVFSDTDHPYQQRIKE